MREGKRGNEIEREGGAERLRQRQGERERLTERGIRKEVQRGVRGAERVAWEE